MDAIEKEVERIAAKVPSLYPTSSSPSTSSSSTPVATSSKRSASGSTKPKSSSSSTSLTTASVSESLDGLLASLETIRSSLLSPATTAGAASSSSSSSSSLPSAPVVVAEVKSSLNRSQKAIADRQKEVYNALSRLGKAYDKKFTMSVEGIADPGLFMGPEPQRALEAIVLDHLLRTEKWEAAEQLSKDSGVPLPRSRIYAELESILSALGTGNVQPAIYWAANNRDFLENRDSPLEYALLRSHFIRVAMAEVAADGSKPPSPRKLELYFDPVLDRKEDPEGWFYEDVDLTPLKVAFQYGREQFRRHLKRHLPEVQALFCLLLFLPRVVNGGDGDFCPTRAHPYIFDEIPHEYHYFLDPNLMHTPYLIPLFQTEFCARHKLSKEAPLKIAVEVGIGGALMKIMKVRKVMQLSGNEWSQADELPIDIPLPSSLRFHSTFTCPVSKEQATEDNPPMMMACGHVLCAESLTRLGKSQGRVKCPYCPMESTIAQATRLYF